MSKKYDQDKYAVNVRVEWDGGAQNQTRRFTANTIKQLDNRVGGYLREVLTLGILMRSPDGGSVVVAGHRVHQVSWGKPGANKPNPPGYDMAAPGPVKPVIPGRDAVEEELSKSVPEKADDPVKATEDMQDAEPKEPEPDKE